MSKAPSGPAATGRRLAAVPAPAVFLASGTTLYLGAAVAVGLFDRLAAPAVGWWRIALAAVVLVAWRRPWQRRWTARGLAWAAAFGVVLAGMNISFYVGLEHLPLGLAVAIEFSGPVVVGAVTGRGWRERAAILVAAAGVVLLTGAAMESGIPHADAVVGLAAIAVAAVCWAGYIVLGKQVAGAGAGIDSLTIGMATGALVFAPFFAHTAPTVVADPRILAFLLVVAVCSSVVPYVLDQVVLRRAGTARFAVLTALLPATAVLVGAVVLRQVPTWPEAAGLALVSGAILMTARAEGGGGGGLRGLTRHVGDSRVGDRRFGPGARSRYPGRHGGSRFREETSHSQA